MVALNLSKADLHLLRVFAAVVEARGFAAAQIALNVSPSTISRQITDLEIRLGMKLCQRGRSGFRVTQQGDRVYRAAQKLFASVREFSETVDGTREALVGALSIAVIDNWVFNETSQFAAALGRFVEMAPGVEIELFSMAPDDIEMAVRDRRVMLGIGVFHRQKPGLVYESIGFETMSLYCAAGHPLFGAEDEEEIAAGLKETRYAERAYLAEREVAPVSRGLTSNARAHQIEGIAHLILTGRYVGYLPQQFADIWVRRDRMRPVAGDRFDRPSELQLVRQRGADPGLVQRTFEDLLRKGGTA